MSLNMFEGNRFGMVFVAEPSNVCSLNIMHWWRVSVNNHSVFLQKGQDWSFENPNIVEAWHANPHRKMYFIVRCHDIIKMLWQPSGCEFHTGFTGNKFDWFIVQFCGIIDHGS